MKSINWATGLNIDYRTLVIRPEDVAAATAPRASLSEVFQFRRSVAVTWITNFLQSVMDYGFVLWAPTLLAMVLKVPPMRAAKMFMAIAFTSMIAKFVWAFLSEVIGRRVGGMLIGVGAAILCLIISRFWNVWIGSVPVIYISFIAVYCFTNGGWSITGPYSAESLAATPPGYRHGRGVGLRRRWQNRWSRWCLRSLPAART